MESRQNRRDDCFKDERNEEIGHYGLTLFSNKNLSYKNNLQHPYQIEKK